MKKVSYIIRSVFKWSFFTVVVLLIISTCWNLVSGLAEKSKTISNTYGKTMDINGRTMIYDIKGEENDKTIVILPGMGSTSPVLEFEPLAEKLSQNYKVITLEPLGYGFSEQTDAKRTVENVVLELRTCIAKLGITKYYLMAHSYGGIYTLEWSNKYENEVMGVIGIDMSVPKQDTLLPMAPLLYVSTYSERTLNFLGIERLGTVVAPRSTLCCDPNYKYTDEEIDTLKFLTLNVTGNKTMRNEVDEATDTMDYVREMKYPVGIPVLNFVSSENCGSFDKWEQFHNDVVLNRGKSELIVVEGSHYLHFDDPDTIVTKVNEWVG